MKNKKVCDAKIWHGSGHQSRTKCHLTREHIIHEAYYGAHNQLARWIGDEVCSEFFNEPPEFDENNDKIEGVVWFMIQDYYTDIKILNINLNTNFKKWSPKSIKLFKELYNKYGVEKLIEMKLIIKIIIQKRELNINDLVC